MSKLILDYLLKVYIILPFVISVLFFIYKTNNNDFSLLDPTSMFLLFLAGPMTVILLFFYIRGLENTD